MDSTFEWFDALYIKYSKKMVSIAMRMGFTNKEAEDIMQDAFLLLLTKAERFQNGHDNPGGFLMETLKNLIGTRLRHQKVLKFIPYEERPETATTDTYFASLKDNLPPQLKEEDKMLLIARYEEQLSYAEMSKRLGISENQCAVMVYRARRKYQKLLEDGKNF